MTWIGTRLQRMRSTRAQIRMLMIATGICLIAAIALLPHAVDSIALLVVRDDPAALADRRLEQTFNEAAAAREIEAALAANDPELAQSFVDLAKDRDLAVSPELIERTDEAVKAENDPASVASHFARGLIVGEPDDLVSLAGTALGDLFVFGDVRDVVREGSRLAVGQEADKLILGLAAVGIAVTAGTYATMGTGMPARIGLSVVKAARKTGRLGTRMGEWIARSLRGVVDWTAMRNGLAAASLTEPAIAVRAVREAVKVEKADDLFRLTRDVGRVQTKAGTRAALDGLMVADNPQEMARVAKLAEAKGGKTRAILKYLGRGAIALSVAAFDLSLWVFWALLMIFSGVATMKRAVERSTERHLRKKKERKMKRQLEARERERLAMALREG
jgi:hypothetical protein